MRLPTAVAWVVTVLLAGGFGVWVGRGANGTGPLSLGEPVRERVTEGALPSVVTVFTTVPSELVGTGSKMRLTQPQRGEGSGFIVDTNGYVVTNDHVVAGASVIKVQFPLTGKSMAARVVGTDYGLDLALLKVPIAKGGLKPLRLGPSGRTKPGSVLVAIGSPEGLVDTVTSGVLSARGRSFTIGKRHYKSLLQTDAAINPGNSGGPLLNGAGEVIGVNTAANTSAYGLGFAIPSDVVKRELPFLERQHLVGKGWLGLGVLTLTPAVATLAAVPPTDKGVLITVVMPGSAAATAGFKPGQVVNAVDGRSVRTANAMVAAIEKLKPGATATVTLEQGTTRRVIRVAVEQRPSEAV